MTRRPLQITKPELCTSTPFGLALPLKLVLTFGLLLSWAAFQATAQVKPKENAPPGFLPSTSGPQTSTQAGVRVEFAVESVSIQKKSPAGYLAGTEAVVRLKIVDANEGKPINNLRPAVWIDRRGSGQPTDARQCREKVQALLQPGVGRVPTLDLNAYYVLALNHEPNISVIDPLSGFGGSKLYALIALDSSGADWALSADRKRLYVSMPQASAVAVIDTSSWKPLARIDAGVQATRLALQHDGKYLWVGNDAEEESRSGVSVIDTATLKVAAQLRTGAGHHEIAFAADDSLAFITNRQSGTLSVIDVRALASVADIKVGSLPSAVAFSPLSKALYVANQGEGTIAVVDGRRREILARLKAEPGISSLRIAPDGRFGFAVNPATSRVYIFDLSSNRLLHAVPVASGADQIMFTDQFAYVRALGSEFVTMIRITDLDKDAEVGVTRFPGGQKSPKESPASTLADAIVLAPGNSAVLVANPADKMIYYYTEGMAAPMGSFQNYRRDPKALLVLDNGLIETAPGLYTTTVRLPAAGTYDVVLLLDSPRLVNCFTLVVGENPDLPKVNQLAIRIEPLLEDRSLKAGESYTLRFKVTDATTHLPKSELEDISGLIFLAPGTRQQLKLAKSSGDGVYEMSFVPPQAGVYYVYFQCPSLGLRFNQQNPVILQAIKP